MKEILFTSVLSVLMCIIGYSQDKSDLISGALLAAPEHMRENATVKGYNENGDLITLREGTNKIICIADNPQKEGFTVNAYYADLDPFMERGRELRKMGKSRQEVFDIREKEVKTGGLQIPHNSILYVLSGDSYDSESGEVESPYMRWVVYIPYATEETTGMATSPPAPGAPWLMDPGTHRAHIMITPPKDE